jgi:hypothetical protein
LVVVSTEFPVRSIDLLTAGMLVKSAKSLPSDPLTDAWQLFERVSAGKFKVDSLPLLTQSQTGESD